MIRALVVDDEPLGRRRLRRLLLDHPDVEVVADAADGRAARREVLTRRPDLIFLDVQMPAEDGPTALRGLRETLPDAALPLVVFTTAHAEHAIDAFELEAIDYLLKPVERSGLARAMKRVRRRLAERGVGAVPGTSGGGAGEPTPPEVRRLLAHRGSRTIPLELESIGAVVLEDDTVRAWTTAGQFRLDGTLREVAERLPAEFVQVSRAAYVRLEVIAELRPLASGTYQAALRDIEGVVHVSRRRGRELKRLLGG